MKPVTKTTDNVGGNWGGAPSATTDKVFLLSATEVYGDMQSDGLQYECYKSKGVTGSNYSGASGYSHWTRSESAQLHVLSLCSKRRYLLQLQRDGLVLCSPRFLLLISFSAKPSQSCEGFSFGDYSNNSRFIAQVIGLRRNGVIQRFSERVAHSPAITSAASSYRAHPAWRFVATAHLSTDQVNYRNKYSDTFVRYSRYICVKRRDKYGPYSAVYQLRVCRFISR